MSLLLAGIGSVWAAPPDDDGDGVSNTSDNCVSIYNPGQEDTNTNGIGDACEDIDSDGSPYSEEVLAGTSDNDSTMRPYWWKTLDGGIDSDFGWSVSDAGDVNSDGYDDVIVGAPMDDTNGFRSGYAQVFSGLDGASLHAFYGNEYDAWFGYSVSGPGDVNNDGYADLLVGSHYEDSNGLDSGSARLFSGLDGSILYTFNGDSADDWFGYSVSGAGDVNNDGYPDMIVGAWGDDNNGAKSGSARVFSGVDGAILYTFDGDNARDHLGFSVSGAGDVNNDGYADLIAGARWDDNNGNESGSARVFSGVDGSALFTFDGDSANDRFGVSVSNAGDVNSDGYADLIVGAWADDNNGTGSGSARVFSGLDGSIFYTFNGDDTYDGFGWSVSDAGDVDGDGYDDLLVGSDSNESRGIVRIFSGKNGNILYDLDYYFAWVEFGYSVSGAGDVDADGYPDIIMGAYVKTEAQIFLTSDLMNDVDTDFQVNSVDPDDDNDGYLDGNDVFPLDASEWLDTDTDGVGNNADWDDDNDGVPDTIDVDPLDNANTGEINLPADGSYKGSLQDAAATHTN